MTACTHGRSKRKEPTVIEDADASLERVARALDSATRVGIGATFATGACERFPPPALALKGGNDGDALLLPLCGEDALKIKARATVSAQSAEAKATAWTVDGTLVETRNPRWARFLDECIVSMRKRLGIAPTAVVNVVLRAMVLAEAGARLVGINTRDTEDGDRDGAFGTLLVVLPGAFRGGAFVVQNAWPVDDEDDEEDEEDDESKEVISWRTTEEESAYDVVYAVFHNQCEIVAEPLVDGTALCLVYDLLTTTPTEIPLYSGSAAIQESIEAALTEYFDVVPADMTKRLKISPDAWRTIAAFAAERHFVYLLGGERFDMLRLHEAKIAQSLAAFCERSGGQYVLYVAKVLCSRLSHTGSDTESGSDDDELLTETSVTLTAPWTRVNARVASSYAPIHVRLKRDVAPVGQLDRLPWHSYKRVNADSDILKELYANNSRVEVYTTRALVVQPVSIEQRQLAQLPIPEMLKTLRTITSTSRDEALRYARRVIYYRPEWRVVLTDANLFAEFLQLLIEINDCDLFNDLLRTVDLLCIDIQEPLDGAVRHFGLDNCFDTVFERIRSTPTWCGRVNLVVAVVNTTVSVERVDRLLDGLLALYPWTDVQVKPSTPPRFGAPNGNPDYDAFRDLLCLGYRSSAQKAMEVASVRDPKALVCVVVPTLIWMVRTVKTTQQVQHVRGVLRHVSALLTTMMPAIRNEPFASIRLPDHCDKCSELQAFVSSTAAEITLQCVDTVERDHVEDVVRRWSWHPLTMAIDLPDATTVRLAKHPGFGQRGLWMDAQRQEANIRAVLAAETDKDNDVAGGSLP